MLVDSEVTYLGVMANYMCHAYQVTRHPDIWLNIISGCACVGVSGPDEHLNWQTEQRRLPSPVWVDIIQH